MKKIVIKIEGMTCSGCSSGLERFLNKQQGIKKAEVSLVLNNASIEYDENVLDISSINNFIKEAGFKSLGIDTYEFENRKLKKERINLIVTTVIGIIIMCLSMGYMMKFLNKPYMNLNDHPKVYGILLAILTTVVIGISIKIIVVGIKKLIHKMPNMDSLISLSVITSYLYSLFNLIMLFIKDVSYVHKIYFESAAMVLVFTKIGRYIDDKSKMKAREAITNLVTMTPSKATILKDGKEIKLTIDRINKDDIVICKPGEKIAVDGRIINGISHINDSFITGESMPRMVKKGDTVMAGSINTDGYIEYVAERVGRDSTVSEIVRTVIKAVNSKPDVVKHVDKICYFFVPAIIIIALIASIVWLCLGQPVSFVFNIFVSILVVACPCALGLATPMAIVEASRFGIRKGILIKNTKILENINSIDTIVFDKTGTLTEGNLSVSKINRYSDMTENGILQLIGSIEKKSEHPIAKAIVNKCVLLGIKLFNIKDIEILPGLGAKAMFKNQEILVGSKKLMEKSSIDVNESDDEEMYLDGNTVIYMSIDNKLIASVGLKDNIKNTAKEITKKLHSDNMEIVMLTGDNENIANIIAKELNIEKVIAGVMPGEKADKINWLRKKRKVMMVGDGINDAPSLVSADIGVSLEGATDIALDSSDVILMKSDLTKLDILLKLSKKTIRIIKQNLFWAFIYNIIMIPIACGILNKAGIILTPMYSAIAMTLSSLFVVLNSLRLRCIR